LGDVDLLLLQHPPFGLGGPLVRADLAAIEYGDHGRPLTMSFGAAALAPDEPLEELRRRADDALYRAKRGGRNSVVVADETDEN